MKLLVTGAGGMLGQDVVRAVVAGGHEVVALTHAQLDIADAEAVSAAVGAAAPSAVLNCAAYTDVDGAESAPDAAAAVNAVGAGNVAAAAAGVGAWVVHVSTDYVFDGTPPGGRAYVESDPTGPLCVYGATKLLGERAVALNAPASHTIVRSSWLFGTGGRCFPDTILRLAAERDELQVVDDQVGCPTFTGHLAAALVALAVGPERVSGVLHLAGGGQCSWFQFATEIVAAAGGGGSAVVRPCTTAEFPRPARRPAHSVLRSERSEGPVLPDWPLGLREYLSAWGAS